MNCEKLIIDGNFLFEVLFNKRLKFQKYNFKIPFLPKNVVGLNLYSNMIDMILCLIIKIDKILSKFKPNKIILYYNSDNVICKKNYIWHSDLNINVTNDVWYKSAMFKFKHLSKFISDNTKKSLESYQILFNELFPNDYNFDIFKIRFISDKSERKKSLFHFFINAFIAQSNLTLFHKQLIFNYVLTHFKNYDNIKIKNKLFNISEKNLNTKNIFITKNKYTNMRIYHVLKQKMTRPKTNKIKSVYTEIKHKDNFKKFKLLELFDVLNLTMKNFIIDINPYFQSDLFDNKYFKKLYIEDILPEDVLYEFENHPIAGFLSVHKLDKTDYENNFYKILWLNKFLNNFVIE